jgi:hypothetical protein
MGVYGGPNKVKGGIVFSLDGANPNSYAGDSPTTVGTDYGYVAGGYFEGSPGGGPRSDIDRIDYSNDTPTATRKSYLTFITRNQGGASNQSYGYFAGGGFNNPGAKSSVDRIDYSNDSATAVAKGPLSSPSSFIAASGNISYGYFAGGKALDGTPSPWLSRIDRLDYSSDTSTAAPKGPLTGVRYGAAGAGNQDYGWIGGARNSPPGTSNQYSSVDRIDYSNDTATASARGPLTVSGGYMGATGNADYGYWMGGYPSYTRISRIDYSNDTPTSTNVYSASPLRHSIAATGNQSYGWFAGGWSPSARSSIVLRLDYSNDTGGVSTRGPLSATRYGGTATSSRENAHPTAGSPATRSATQINGSPYGYYGGGFNPSPGEYSSIERIDYDNDTATAVVKGSMTLVRRQYGATGNTSYGYNGGGRVSHNTGTSIVDRIDYSSDSSTTSPKGPLSIATHSYPAAVGNASYGYWGGGVVPGTVSIVDRIDYSNDTPTASPKGPLSSVRSRMAATGNSDYGYFGAGSPGPKSTVERLDYSSDTTTGVVKGPLTVTRDRPSATGNASYGYWSGGNDPSSLSSVDRLDFSSDTTAASPKGPLSTPNHAHGGTGNTSYGYFAGGNGAGSPYSKLDRVDYSNDTPTTAVRGNLSADRREILGSGVSSQANSLGASTVYPWYDTSGRGNTANITDSRFRATDGGYFTFDGTGDYLTVPSTTDFAFGTEDFTVEYWVKTNLGGYPYGYWSGGSPAGSLMDRLDYDNDTATAVTKGPLSSAKGYMGAHSTKDYAYWSGGYNDSTYLTTIDRTDYSSDTTTAAAKGPLSLAKLSFSGAGNLSYGYWGGGSTPGGRISSVDRTDYSNDTATAVAKGPLTYATQSPASTGTPSYGYWAGGISPSSPAGYNTSGVSRIDYSSDTPTAATKGPLSYGRSTISATGNASYGYFGGGNKGVPAKGTHIDRIDYSNDTATASPKGNFEDPMHGGGSNGNSSDGYWNGGQQQPTYISRIDYSNDTAIATRRSYQSSNFKRGNVGTGSRIQGFDSLTAANIINPDSETGSGYWAHQYDTTFDWNSVYDLAAGPAYGYHAGGIGAPDPNYFSNVDRIDYSNDTATAVAKGPLTRKTNDPGSTGNTSYGYYAAGYSDQPGYSSTNTDVQRLDYGNDTATTSPKGNLATAGSNSEGVGNASYGYNNTSPAKTLVQRIDFGNDTATATPKGPLTNAVSVRGAAGNQSYGYMAGGYPFNTIMNRIDYADDTATALAKGPLANTNMYALAATGNSDFGYFAGGGVQSYVNRLDYSNDSTTTSPKGNLSSPRAATQGAGTADYGYIVGGKWGGPEPVSNVDRIDYSNDTATAATKGPLTAVRRYAVGASSRNNALPAGSTELYTCALSPVNDGSWHNVVMTRVGGTQQTYYDGVGITTTGGTYTDGTNYSGVDGWFIGKGNPAVGVSTFSGNLANITIRKGKGLSSDEVQQNFNALRKRFGV